jgi:hypothetical protein
MLHVPMERYGRDTPGGRTSGKVVEVFIKREWPAWTLRFQEEEGTCLDVVFSRNVQKSTISIFKGNFFSANPKRTMLSSLSFSGGFSRVD